MLVLIYNKCNGTEYSLTSNSKQEREEAKRRILEEYPRYLWRYSGICSVFTDRTKNTKSKRIRTCICNKRVAGRNGKIDEEQQVKWLFFLFLDVKTFH